MNAMQDNIQISRAVSPELLVEVGRTARLGCEVRGYPAPRTAWVKEGTGDTRIIRRE